MTRISSRLFTGAVVSATVASLLIFAATASAASPPKIAKAFGNSNIPLNGTTSLTFAITNPNAGSALTHVSFTDNLPFGLVVAPNPGVSNSCAGTVTAKAGAQMISFSGGTVAASSTCMISMTVRGISSGTKNNSTSFVTSDQGMGNVANASITVIGPPTLIEQFGAASIPVNGTTSLTFKITNSNFTALSGVAFTDNLPAGLVVTSPPGISDTCGGIATATGGGSKISLSDGAIAASSSCMLSLSVTGTTAGNKNNTTGTATSNEGGTDGTATASVVVEAPPTIAKAFNPNRVLPGQTTSLTFTIANPAVNHDPEAGVAFVDVLPTGLTVGNSTTAVCSGTLTTLSGSGLIMLGFS